MKNYSEIDANDLFNLIDDAKVQLVDVRNQEEVDRGIISGAIHIQLAMLPLLYEKLMKNDTVIFYCHSGIRSAHAADFAVNKGVKNVHNLVGGIVDWNKAGYPLITKK
jgi:rhodanese-related sulfurtransferase